MNILITGSDGYLGSVLSERLRLVIANITKIDLGLFNRSNFIKFDLSKDSFSLLNYNKIDTVVHLAGISNDPASELDPELTYRMNVLASKRLIDWAEETGVRKFVFASSASVYGFNEHLCREDGLLFPQSAYAESKVVIENYLRSKTTLNPVILRFGTLFGFSPKMRFDLAINLMVRDSVTTSKIKIFGDGSQFRPFLNVRDASRAIEAALYYKGSDTFNIASFNSNIKDLAEKISYLTFSGLIYTGESNDTRSYKLDTSKMKHEFNFNPIFNLETEVKNIYDWASAGRDLNSDIYYTLRMWKKFYKENYNG